MTIVLPVQSKIAENKEELTHVKRTNRDLKKADEQYAVKVANLEKKLEKAQAETEHNKKEAEYYKDEMKAKCGFDTREKAYEREIRDLKVERDRLAKALKAEQELVQSNFIANTEQREELKQARKDLEDFEAMKSENIRLNQSILKKTEVRDAQRKMEKEKNQIQRVADEKVRRLEEELGAKQERIERLERAARQKEEEEEDGNEDADGMDD
jgi:chromosome segregation ATPase